MPSSKSCFLNKLVISTCLFASSSVVAGPLPPNTMTIDTNNPVLSSLPSDIAQGVVPSTPSLVNGQVNDYLSAQLSAAQIDQLKQDKLRQDRSLASPYVEMPIPVVRSLAVDLAPAKTPPVIRLAYGMVTSLVVTDINGNAWPVEKVVLNGNQFINHSTPSYDAEGNENGVNIIMIEPIQAVGWSNMTIKLKDKPTPIIFLLSTGQREVDLRVDTLVKGRSPLAPITFGSAGGIQNVTDIDNNTLSFLDGSIPDKAEELKTSSPYVRAWRLNDKLYVRTRYDVLYPSYSSKASSADGEHSYRFDKVLNEAGNGSITLTQRVGQPITVRIEANPYSYIK